MMSNRSETTLSQHPRALARLFMANLAPQAAVIVLFAALLVFPYLATGLSAGYDARTHVQYQHHFSDQFWSGEAYPRWLDGANKGYGSPTFLIQYPLPYFVTSLLRPVMRFPESPDREANELGVFCFIVVASAGLASWYWFRRFATASAATLAALIYVFLPYLLTCLYVRAAIGELSALVFMPLSLGLCESIHRKPWALFVVSVSLAFLFLSNPLIAMLFIPAFLFYGYLSGRQAGVERCRIVGRLTLSILLGAGIASPYLLPLFFYRGLFDPNAMALTLPDFQLGHYFSSVATSSISTVRMRLSLGGTILLLLASTWGIASPTLKRPLARAIALLLAFGGLSLVPDLGLAFVNFNGFVVPHSSLWESFAAQIALTSLATFTLAVLAIVCIGDRVDLRQIGLLSTAAIAFALMLPFSAPVWRVVPGLQMLQFPFRFGAIMVLATAGLIAAALDHLFVRCDRRSRVLLSLFGLAVTGVVLSGIGTFGIDNCFRRFSSPVKYEDRRNIDVNYRMYVPPAHVEGFAKAMGSRPDSYSSVPTEGDGTLRLNVVGAEDCVQLTRDGSRKLLLEADCQRPVTVHIGQLNFPLWRKIQVTGGSEHSVLKTSSAGLMELRLAPGKQTLRLEFDVKREERWGVLVSVVSLLVSGIASIVVTAKGRRNENTNV